MEPIYLDHQATTPTDRRVVAAMERHWCADYGNPHSQTHAHGWRARDAVERARKQVAAFLGAYSAEVVFTSGATESCNLALRGTAETGTRMGRSEVVTVATEHPAVLETVRWLARRGHSARILPVRADGILDMQEVEDALSERTLLVSVMLANNEIGVVQPVAEIARLAHRVGAVMHTDATQAAGRIPVDVDVLDVDLLSISGHKLYGPNGIGVLYLRDRPGLRIAPMMTGGSQERGLRPGTVPVPLAVGMGVACALAADGLSTEAPRLRVLTRGFLDQVRASLPEARLFGHAERRIPGSLSLGFPGVPGEFVVRALSGTLSLSTGAACASGSTRPSHVLGALGLDAETASTGVRISPGRFTTLDEMRTAGEMICRAVRDLGGRP